MNWESVETIFVLIICVRLIIGLGSVLVASWEEADQRSDLNAQANRDCVQLGYAGGELAPDMPNALRCWTVILVDEKGQ